MSAAPVVNPEIPYVGEVEGGLTPGKLVRIRGKVPSEAVRFAVNYQLGPTLNPRDDIALHVSPRFADGIISRSHIVSMNWGPFEDDGPMWIQPGEDFEMIILCDHAGYKIAINGKHFTEFAHRLPYEKVTHLVIDGDVEVSLIAYETVAVAPSRSARSAPVSDVPSANYGPPPPGGLYPTLDTQGGYGPPPSAGYGPPPAGYGPPPAGYGPPPAGYGPPPYGGPNGYNPSQGYRPGYEKPEEEDTFSGCLDKVGLALGGLVAAGGVAAAMHAMNKKKEESEEEHEKSDGSKKQTQSEGGFGNLGALGAALATSLATNALQRNLHAQQGYPPVESGAGGVLGSILGALGGAGAPSQPAYAPPPPASDPLSGALGSILGGVLGGGGGQQQPAYQPSGGYGYGGSGGYGNQQGSTGSNLLSGIGSAIGSSLFSSALDGLTKHGKDKSHGDSPRDRNPPSYGQSTPAAPPPSNSDSPPSSGGQKLTADEISKGLGLDD